MLKGAYCNWKNMPHFQQQQKNSDRDRSCIQWNVKICGDWQNMHCLRRKDCRQLKVKNDSYLHIWVLRWPCTRWEKTFHWLYWPTSAWSGIEIALKVIQEYHIQNGTTIKNFLLGKALESVTMKSLLKTEETCTISKNSKKKFVKGWPASSSREWKYMYHFDTTELA